jgi:YggT family protein
MKSIIRGCGSRRLNRGFQSRNLLSSCRSPAPGVRGKWVLVTACCQLASVPPCLAAIIPIAREVSKQDIFYAASLFIDVYLVVLAVRVFLMLFASLDWGMEPFNSLSKLTDPYLNLFQIQMFGVNLSPFLAIGALIVISKQLGGFMGI